MRTVLLACGRETRISDVDYDRVIAHRWSINEHTASGKPYVRTTIAGKTVYLHRFITNCPPNMKTDHRDRITLHNERPNLRIASFDQNNANREGYSRSGYKGVVLEKRQWRARIKINGKDKHLGMFRDIRDAARAYDAAAFDMFGEFAYLNFPADYPTPEDLPESVIPF